MANVGVHTLVGNDAAVAQVKVELPGSFSVSLTGSSKRHPNDPSLGSVGEALALSRALEKAAVELREFAMSTNAYHVELVKMDRVWKALEEEGYEV